MRTAKVAIVSIYRICNYGSTLQAVALQSVVRSLGFDCEHVNYSRCRENLPKWKTLAHCALDPIRRVFRPELRMRARFESFCRSNLKETEKVSDGRLQDLNCRYDAFICGSDQIWAPNQFNPVYFLSFVTDSKKKIAYAPSVGLPSVPESLKRDYVRLISDIQDLSVRGEQDAGLVRQLTGVQTKSVLDPTLLLSKDAWIAKATRRSIGKGAYLFCYLLGDEPSHRRAIEVFAMAKGIRVLAVTRRRQDWNWGGIEVRTDLGPAEWLRAICDASYVITDSYHGMLFSVLMHKEFFEILRFAEDNPICQNSRVYAVAEKLGLNSRVLPFANPVVPLNFPVIDYSYIDGIVAKERMASLEFLRAALEAARGG